MFCRKCGAENLDDARFCIKCGAELDSDANVNNNFVNQQMIDTSIIRKAIKAKAKASSKSSLVVTFILVILLAILGVIIAIANIGVGIIYFLLYIISLIFIFFGIIKSSLDISRGKQVEYLGVIKGSFKNPSWCLKYIVGAVLFSLVMSILMFIPILGFILGIIAEIYFMPVLVIYMYKLADPNIQDKSISSLIKSSMALVKGHRVEFYGLLLSFFGWFLLGIITLGIALIWVIPYITLAFANFYRYLNNEEEYTNAQKGISNGAIIALGIIGYFVFIALIVIVVILVVVGVIISNPSGTYGSIFIENMEGVNVAIPTDYNEYTVSGYDKAYMNEEGTILIATKVMSATNMDLDTYSEAFKNALPTSYTCGAIESRAINGDNWNKLTCDYSGGTNIYNYIATDSSNIYLVTVTAHNDARDEGKSVANDVEKNLSFAN